MKPTVRLLLTMAAFLLGYAVGADTFPACNELSWRIGMGNNTDDEPIPQVCRHEPDRTGMYCYSSGTRIPPEAYTGPGRAYPTADNWLLEAPSPDEQCPPGQIKVPGSQGFTCSAADIQGHTPQGANPHGPRCPGGAVDEAWLYDEDGIARFFIGCLGIKGAQT